MDDMRLMLNTRRTTLFGHSRSFFYALRFCHHGSEKWMGKRVTHPWQGKV